MVPCPDAGLPVAGAAQVGGSAKASVTAPERRTRRTDRLIATPCRRFESDGRQTRRIETTTRTSWLAPLRSPGASSTRHSRLPWQPVLTARLGPWSRPALLHGDVPISARSAALRVAMAARPCRVEGGYAPPDDVAGRAPAPGGCGVSLLEPAARALVPLAPSSMAGVSLPPQAARGGTSGVPRLQQAQDTLRVKTVWCRWPAGCQNSWTTGGSVRSRNVSPSVVTTSTPHSFSPSPTGPPCGPAPCLAPSPGSPDPPDCHHAVSTTFGTWLRPRCCRRGCRCRS